MREFVNICRRRAEELGARDNKATRPRVWNAHLHRPFHRDGRELRPLIRARQVFVQRQGHIEAKTKGFGSKVVSQADIDKYELSDDDVSFLEEADGERKTRSSAITRKQAGLGGMGGSDPVVTRAGKGSCMAVCASGQYPEVGAKCHANIMTKQFGREAETKEMKTLVDRLVLETNRVR